MRLHARRLARCISGQSSRRRSLGCRDRNRGETREERIFLVAVTSIGAMQMQPSLIMVAAVAHCTHTDHLASDCAGPPLFLFICIVYLHATATEWKREGEHYDIRRQRCDRRRLLFNDNKLLVDKTDDNVPLVQVLVLNMLFVSFHFAFRLSLSSCDSRRTFRSSQERKK